MEARDGDGLSALSGWTREAIMQDIMNMRDSGINVVEKLGAIVQEGEGARLKEETQGQWISEDTLLTQLDNTLVSIENCLTHLEQPSH